MSGVSGVCGNCLGKMVSTHRHDLAWCGCGMSYVDGGNVDYVRCGGDVRNLDTWDWTTADNRQLKAEDITDDHYRAIIEDGYRLRGKMKEEAMKRGLFKTPIISFSGYAGSGKDSIAQAICDDEPTKWVPMSFAEPMKQMVADTLGYPVHVLEEIKSGSDGPEKAKKVRKILQLIGTEVFRDNWSDDIWVDHLMRRVEALQTRGALITDTRYPNELEALEARGAFLVRVTCPEEYRRAPPDHPTETALDAYEGKFNLVINNDRSETPEELAEMVLEKFEEWRNGNGV